MTELDRNLEEVSNKALETGEKIVTLECPCCGKTYYATESEVVYTPPDYVDQSLKQLGRKCPFCGFSGGISLSGSEKLDAERDRMQVEMEAEQMAQEAADKRQIPWSEVNKMGLEWKN